MDDLKSIDSVLVTFIQYIDSGFGLLQGDVSFLTTVRISASTSPWPSCSGFGVPNRGAIVAPGYIHLDNGIIALRFNAQAALRTEQPPDLRGGVAGGQPQRSTAGSWVVPRNRAW